MFFWPSAEERKEISLRLQQKWIDGAHLNLNTRLELCGEEYFMHKTCYMFIVDDNKCIGYANVGLPGSVHNNCIWSNTKIICDPDNFCAASEYIIGDTALTNSCILE
jgi:hypothetical protein